MKVFKSKIGYGILIPVLVLLIGLTLLPIINGAPTGSILVMVSIMVPVIALTLNIFFRTTYRINDNQLLIKCGFFYKATVDILAITTVSRTRNPISSPAASLDRIELKYGKWESVIISPDDKMAFVNELLKINPNIQHKLK
jgi:hypothetical protein